MTKARGGLNNPINALQGKIAGLQITSSSGSMGGSSKVLLRGVSSLSGNNQPLFVIDQTEHKLRVQNAQANLAAAKAQMETTRLQYETNQKLAAKKIVSDYVMSTSMNAYHVAQAAVQQAQAQLSIAQTNLGYCTVTSPITGIIKENGFKIGEVASLSDIL